MAFKKATQDSAVPDSPDKLLLDLPRRRIPDVLPHQREVMRTYAKTAAQKSDVALQLPTGSGKTLVGLLIGEWMRRKNQEKIVYLCPTKQLVNQVVEQADEKYGLTVLGFTGGITKYNPNDKAEYRTASRLAVTTYSSLFNTNPFFDDADVVIVDDAHAAENYIAALWSLQVDRFTEAHKALHAAACNVLKPVVDALSFSRMCGAADTPADKAWVDKLPTTTLQKLAPALLEVLEEHVEAAGLRHPWSMLREHLHACHLYLSSNSLLLRPLIPPTWTHAPFESPRQRIYMSATLGAGGDLERLTGRRAIHRVPIPEGWDKQGVGRRFFIFPGMSLKEDEAQQLSCDLMNKAGRSLVLVPSDKSEKAVIAFVGEKLGFPTFSADAIETSKKQFIETAKAVAVVANRYDGIDFPSNECRLLFVEGFPKAMNLQERFLMSRMGANLLFNERIQTRILQAIGRCTRSLEDYSAVVVDGDELPDYLADIKRRRYLHPELQAELRFGIEQSKGSTLTDISENFSIFLENGQDWEDVNQQIVQYRKAAQQEPFPAMNELMAVVSHEVDYQTRLWQSDFAVAFEAAERVLGALAHEDLRGYRALWHYAAGSAAWLAAEEGVPGFDQKARDQFEVAKKTAPAVPWLVSVMRTAAAQGATTIAPEDDLMEQLERVEALFAKFGTLHDRSFARWEREILQGLQSKETFEQAHRQLGEILGFVAGKMEADGTPDPWWLTSGYCFVFEDHAGAEETSVLDVRKARQAFSHPNWMREHVPGSQTAEILAVLVTPVSKAKEGALTHLETVALWRLEDFRAWAQNALASLRQLRTTFLEPGDLIWRSEAAAVFVKQGLDAAGLMKKLKSQSAKGLLIPVK